MAIKFHGFPHGIMCRLWKKSSLHNRLPFPYLSHSLISWQSFLIHSSLPLVCYQDPDFNTMAALFYVVRKTLGFSCFEPCLWLNPLRLFHWLEVPLEVQTSHGLILIVSLVSTLTNYQCSNVGDFWGVLGVYHGVQRQETSWKFLDQLVCQP